MGTFHKETIHIHNLRVEAIIGIHPHERDQPQPLIISLSFPWDFSRAAATEAVNATVDYSDMSAETTRFVQAGKFRLLETLARELAAHLGTSYGLERLDLEVRKPDAIDSADSAAVSLTWTVRDFLPG